MFAGELVYVPLQMLRRKLVKRAFVRPLEHPVHVHSSDQLIQFFRPTHCKCLDQKDSIPFVCACPFTYSATEWRTVSWFGRPA